MPILYGKEDVKISKTGESDSYNKMSQCVDDNGLKPLFVGMFLVELSAVQYAHS